MSSTRNLDQLNAIANACSANCDGLDTNGEILDNLAMLAEAGQLSGNGTIVVDSALNEESVAPVQNRVIAKLIPAEANSGNRLADKAYVDTGLAGKADTDHTHDNSALEAAIDSKVDKEDGKGLSTNDFTTAEKERLASLHNYDDTDLQNEVASKADVDHTHKSLSVTVIPAGADLDNYNSVGHYVSIANEKFVNAPTASFVNFSLEVYQLMNQSFVAQRITQYATGKIYTRTQTYESGSVKWTNWNEFVSTTEMQKEIDEKNLEEKIDRIFVDFKIDKRSQALRFCFVSPSQTSIRYKGVDYTTYTSISSAIDTEYELIDPSYQLGLLCIVLEGTYYDKVRLYGKTNVSIIGINREKCIVENIDHGEEHSYYYPPFWINPSTTIGNLTINCHKFNENSTDAYCIHTDDNGVGRVLIKNCALYCEQQACIGFGTREYAPLFIENCVMHSFNKCIYGHNACGHQVTGTVHEELHIYNCYARSGSNNCIDIFDATNFYPYDGNRPKPLDWLVYMSDNVFLNNNNVDSYPTTLHISPYYEEATDTVNYFSAYIRKMPQNKGNNAPFLNFVDKINV